MRNLRDCGMAAAVLTAAGLFYAVPSTAATPSREVPEGGTAVELALSDGTLQFDYLTDGDTIGVDDGRMDLGLFLSEERDIVLTGGVLVEIEPLVGRWLRIELGPKVYAALLEEENNDVFALSLGGQIRWDVVRSRGIAVVGSAYYAPDIFAFGEADNITDLSARVELRLTEDVVGFAGARWFELDLLDGQERELQEELLVGARWQF